MTQDAIAKAMNEWKRRYIDEPDRFASEADSIAQYLAQQSSGQEPSYGAECAAYLFQIAADLGL